MWTYYFIGSLLYTEGVGIGKPKTIMFHILLKWSHYISRLPTKTGHLFLTDLNGLKSGIPV